MKPFGREHNRRVVEDLNNRGYEMTVDQVVETRKQAYETIRRALVAKGHPELTDEQILSIMRDMKKRGKA